MLELTVKNVFVSADSFTSWSVGKCWRTVCVLVKKSYQLVLRQPTCNTIQRLQCSTSWDWKLTCRFKLEEKSGDFMILRNVNIWHKKKSIVVWVGKMSETGEKCPKTTSSDVSSLPQAKIFSFLRVSSAGVELKSNMPPCRPSRSYLCLQDVQRHIKARHRKTLRQPVVKKKRCGSAARIPGTRTNSTPVTGGDAASHKTQNCFGSKIQMLHFWISVLFPQISGSSFGSPTKQTGQNPVVLLIRSTMRPDAPETLSVKGKILTCRGYRHTGRVFVLWGT